MASRDRRCSNNRAGPGAALNVISDTCSSNEDATEDGNNINKGNMTKCPKLRKKSPRLPMNLWGTETARERERELHRVRQRNYRARKRAEALAARRGRHSSDDDSEEEQMLHQVPLAATCGPDTANIEDSSSSEEDYAKEHSRNQIQKPPACRSLVEDMPQPIKPASEQSSEGELDKLAKLFAQVKCGSNVSDSAMNKLFSTFVKENDIIMRQINEKRIGPSYTKSIRPIVVSKLLPIYTSLYIMEKNARGNKFHRLEGLKSIPNKYLNLPETKKWKLMRMEAYVRLEDVKKQYIQVHGDTEETKKNLLNCQLSVDGVSESRKGSRTFIIVSMRIGNCLFLLHSFNPLVGVPESKPTAVELLQ